MLLSLRPSLRWGGLIGITGANDVARDRPQKLTPK